MIASLFAGAAFLFLFHDLLTARISYPWWLRTIYAVLMFVYIGCFVTTVTYLLWRYLP